MEFELPEDLVLPHEVTDPGYEPRTFHLPAQALNRWLGTVTRATAYYPESAAVD
jgi:hypothetical protein